MMRYIKTYEDSLQESYDTFRSRSGNKLDDYLIDAVANRHTKKVRILLDGGASPMAEDAGGQTVVHYAVENDDIESLEMLIKAGAEVDTPDDAGQTPMHWSAFSNCPGAAKLLLLYGAEPNPVTPKGATPLNWAIDYDSPEVAKALINAGVDPFSERSFSGLKQMLDFFSGDLGWWNDIPDDLKTKAERVSKTKNIFNV